MSTSCLSESDRSRGAQNRGCSNTEKVHPKTWFQHRGLALIFWNSMDKKLHEDWCCVMLLNYFDVVGVHISKKCAYLMVNGKPETVQFRKWGKMIRGIAENEPSPIATRHRRDGFAPPMCKSPKWSICSPCLLVCSHRLSSRAGRKETWKATEKRNEKETLRNERKQWRMKRRLKRLQKRKKKERTADFRGRRHQTDLHSTKKIG